MFAVRRNSKEKKKKAQKTCDFSTSTLKAETQLKNKSNVRVE